MTKGGKSVEQRINEVIIGIQRSLYEHNGTRTDVHVKEGSGVLFVPEGYPLIPQNIIKVVPYEHLEFIAMLNV